VQRGKVVVPHRRSVTVRQKKVPDEDQQQDAEASAVSQSVPQQQASSSSGLRSNRCDALCLADEMDLERISAVWSDGARCGIVPAAKARRLAADVLVLELEDGRLAFTFGFGSVVCWGLDFKELRVVRRLIRRSIGDSLPPEDVEADWLTFSSVPLEEASSEHLFQTGPLALDEPAQADLAQLPTPARPLQNDHICLMTWSVDEALAYSYALAQSVKLAVFENLVDAAIDRSRPIPEALAQKGMVDMDEKLVKQQMGEIFVTKCSMTLQSDILDTPEIIWQNDRYDEQYNVGRKYLEISKRVDILNQRLTVLNDLYSFLQAQLEVRHSNKLEWIIIVLIVVEIMVELFHMSPWYSKRSAQMVAGLSLMSGAIWLRGEVGNSRTPPRVRHLLSQARAKWGRPLVWLALMYGAVLTVRGLLGRSLVGAV